MLAAAARLLIERSTQWTANPALTTAEVDGLLEIALVADLYGFLPGETGYLATYATRGAYRAAAEGWRWKAGKVAGQGDVTAGGGVGLKRSDVYKQCMDQARRYDAKAAGGSLGVIQLVTA